jgi:hypothetical protein
MAPLSHGYALWRPEPVRTLYDEVRIGDVDFLSKGGFHRLFNDISASDNPTNQFLGVPDGFDADLSDSVEFFPPGAISLENVRRRDCNVSGEG